MQFRDVVEERVLETRLQQGAKKTFLWMDGFRWIKGGRRIILAKIWSELLFWYSRSTGNFNCRLLIFILFLLSVISIGYLNYFHSIQNDALYRFEDKINGGDIYIAIFYSIYAVVYQKFKATFEDKVRVAKHNSLENFKDVPLLSSI